MLDKDADESSEGLQRSGALRMPERKLTPGTDLLLRAMAALGCVALATAVVYFGRSGYRDVTDEPLGFVSCLYYATVSLSTTGYGDITPVTESARLMNIFVITPLRVIFLIVLIGTTVEVLTRRTREITRENRWRRKVDHHTVVIGFGVKGRAAVDTLLQHGDEPHRIVVVSSHMLEVSDASEKNVVAVLGDARREDVLRQAEVPRADKVIVAVDEDDATVLITLSVKRLNPRATIIAAARESANADLIRASGAASVIPTAEASGQLLGMACVAPEAGEFMEDLLDPSQGMEVQQRQVTRDEIGLAPADLRKYGQIALAVIRDGETHRFDDGSVKVLQRGDQLIVIRGANPGKKR